MCPLHCGLGMEEHSVKNFFRYKALEINKLIDLNNLRTAPQLNDIQEKKLLEELEAHIIIKVTAFIKIKFYMLL